jgi:EamA domain-containing membrane protein RarD
MIEHKLSLPEIMIIASTRVALGIGIGFLISGRLTETQRKAAGLALVIVGAITTVPLAINLIGKKDVTIEEVSRAA